jgi:hypothetical protein
MCVRKFHPWLGGCSGGLTSVWSACSDTDICLCNDYTLYVDVCMHCDILSAWLKHIIYIYTYVHIYIFTYIHTYIYKYIHTYIHTYTNAKEPSWVAVDPQYKFSLVKSLLHHGHGHGHGIFILATYPEPGAMHPAFVQMYLADVTDQLSLSCNVI